MSFAGVARDMDLFRTNLTILLLQYISSPPAIVPTDSSWILLQVGFFNGPDPSLCLALVARLLLLNAAHSAEQKAFAPFRRTRADQTCKAVFEELGVKNVLQGGYGTVTLEADKQAGRLLLESAKIAAGNVKPAAGPFPHTPRVLWLGVARCAKHLTGAGPVHGDGCGP